MPIPFICRIFAASYSIMPDIYSYKDAKSVVVCGDIHGEFLTLVHKMCVQYDMHDTLVIVAGDCGFGFEKPGYYDNIFRRIQKRLTVHNCWIAMVRGNHDDPAYFAEIRIRHERFRTLPDYSVVEACNHHILCVGGAISIDRRVRLEKMRRSFDKTYYWADEMPVYSPEKLNEIASAGIRIDTVITHTAPSFCEFVLKHGLNFWAQADTALLDDSHTERQTMDSILAHLLRDGHPLTHWYYGHFHHSWHNEIDGIFYTMLDILEFREIPRIE